jgi:undecaprenyl-diphosphatase
MHSGVKIMANPFVRAAFFILVSACAGLAHAGGGPLGIDHVVPMDDKGIWKRSTQNTLLGVMVVGDIGAALWEGGETPIGHTLWQSVDSMLISTVAANGAKLVFSRARPTQTDDPNQWFKGGHHYSFPSGEVSAMSGMVTPFVLEYGKEHPAVWALELLPAYDAVARVKVHAHWQSDVLAGWAVGAGAGYFAHSLDSPWTLGVLPHGATVGFHKQW